MPRALRPLTEASLAEMTEAQLESLLIDPTSPVRLFRNSDELVRTPDTELAKQPDDCDDCEECDIALDSAPSPNDCVPAFITVRLSGFVATGECITAHKDSIEGSNGLKYLNNLDGLFCFEVRKPHVYPHADYDTCQTITWTLEWYATNSCDTAVLETETFEQGTTGLLTLLHNGDDTANVALDIGGTRTYEILNWNMREEAELELASGSHPSWAEGTVTIEDCACDNSGCGRGSDCGGPERCPRDFCLEIAWEGEDGAQFILRRHMTQIGNDWHNTTANVDTLAARPIKVRMRCLPDGEAGHKFRISISIDDLVCERTYIDLQIERDGSTCFDSTGWTVTKSGDSEGTISNVTVTISTYVEMTGCGLSTIICGAECDCCFQMGTAGSVTVNSAGNLEIVVNDSNSGDNFPAEAGGWTIEIWLNEVSQGVFNFDSILPASIPNNILTGIAVVPGDVLRWEASGSIYVNTDNCQVDPDGQVLDPGLCVAGTSTDGRQCCPDMIPWSLCGNVPC